MRLRASFFAVGAVVISLWVARPAQACECFGTSVCPVAERSNAVFTGKAVDVRDESKDYVSAVLKGRTVTLLHIVGCLGCADAAEAEQKHQARTG